MPDTLVNLTSPAAPHTSTATGRMLRLHREMIDAERALNASDQDCDDPLGRRYYKAMDRFVAEPVATMGDILLKLEVVAIYDDTEQQHVENPKLVYVKILLSLLRDLRGLFAGSTPTDTSPDNAGPSLDLVAIHRAADEEVNKIYCLHARLANGLELLREIAQRINLGTPNDGGKLLYLVETLDDAASSVVDANDRLCNAIEPLKPVQVS